MGGSDEFAAYVVDQLGDLGATTARRMFGGHGIFLGPLMFGLIADDVLYFKVDAVNEPAFAAQGMRPFTYASEKGRKRVTMSYWEVPTEVLDDRDALAGWGKDAVAAAQRAQASRRKAPQKKARRR